MNTLCQIRMQGNLPVSRVYLGLPLWRARALFCSKVDEFVSQEPSMKIRSTRFNPTPRKLQAAESNRRPAVPGPGRSQLALLVRQLQPRGVIVLPERPHQDLPPRDVSGVGAMRHLEHLPCRAVEGGSDLARPDPAGEVKSRAREKGRQGYQPAWSATSRCTSR
jgi:hypothetical protein